MSGDEDQAQRLSPKHARRTSRLAARFLHRFDASWHHDIMISPLRRVRHGEQDHDSGRDRAEDDPGSLASGHAPGDKAAGAVYWTVSQRHHHRIGPRAPGRTWT